MAKLDTELFIARRLGTGGESKGVMVRIAVATSAVAIAVMIVAVAVIMGFSSEISNKIAAFAGHLRIQTLDYGGSLETEPIRIDAGLERDIASIEGFRSIAPYALKTGIVKTDEATQGVVLKGVGAGYDLSFFEDCLREGELPRRGEDGVRHKDVLISAAVSRMLRLDVDDRVEMLLVSGRMPPRRDRFRVCGIYSSGLGEMDNRFVLTDIANVQRLYGWGEDEVSGYEIVIDGMERLGEFEKEAARVVSEYNDRRGASMNAGVAVDAVAGECAGEAVSQELRRSPMMVRSVAGDFPQLFDWLATHDVNAAVIIAIMMVVALISMISALLIILLERIGMIGVLKTLGMTNGSLRRMFVMRSARILLWGLLIGNAVGVGLALMQKYTGALKLDESGYFLSAVPIELGWWWIVALNAGTLAVILALLVFPTGIIGRITPEKAVRYQ